MIQPEDMVYPYIEVQKDSEYQKELRNAYCALFTQIHGQYQPLRQNEYIDTFEKYSSFTTGLVANQVENLFFGYTGETSFSAKVPTKPIGPESGVTLPNIATRIASLALRQEAVLRVRNYKHYLIDFAQEDKALWELIDKEEKMLHADQLHQQESLEASFLTAPEGAAELPQGALIDDIRKQSKRIITAQDISEARWMMRLTGSYWVNASQRRRKHPKLVQFAAQLGFL